MASLRRLPNSPYWIACFTLPDGRRTQRSTGTGTRREAQRIANEFEDASREARSGRFNETRARKTIADIFAVANRDTLPSSTIRDFFQSWLKRKELETSAHTHCRYGIVVEHLLDHLGARAGQDIAHLTAKEIAMFRDTLAKRLNGGTVNIELKIVRSALAQARRDGLVDVNEAERVSLLKRSRALERRPFALDELKKILDVADDEWRGMILFGLYTGLRLSDVATLTWANVDLQNTELRLVTGKTGRRMVLPLAKPLVRHLENLPVSDVADAPLFPESFAARQRSQSVGTLSNQFYGILVSAGLAKPRSHQSAGKGRDAKRELGGLSFHCLRHTATSLLKNAGVSDAIARDIIGHDSPAVSANYTHIDMDAKRKALGKLPDVFAKPAS
jgi:integrase